MKNLLLLFILSYAFTAQAQYGYGTTQRQQRQRQMPQMQQEAPEPNFNVDKYAGIIIYDIEKSAKKSGIKLKSKVGKVFLKTLTTYNKQIKDIRRINSFTLKSTKEMVENFQKTARKTGDFSNQTEIQKKLIENIKPISETLKNEYKKLDTSLKETLSEKQYKKWIKYNKKQGKVFPEKEN